MFKCTQALATASAFGDRLCIASNTTINKVLSGEYINSCCNGEGCNGGHPEEAWKFIKTKGLCTGGEYGSAVVSFVYLIIYENNYVGNYNTDGLLH